VDLSLPRDLNAGKNLNQQSGKNLQQQSGRNVKRQTYDVCSCLTAAQQCLSSTSCATETSLVGELCNWNFGRTFGSCSICTSLASVSESPATAGDILYAIGAMSSSISEAIPLVVTEISSVSFTTGATGNTIIAEITLAPGVVSDALAYNKLVYQLSRLLDVYPGTISWSNSAKRQTGSILLTVVDEPSTSGSSSLFLSLTLVLALIQVFLF